VAAVSLERRPTSPSVYSRISDKNPWDTLAEPGLAKLADDNSPLSRHASLTSLDIKDILNSATIYNFKDNDSVSDVASDVSPTSHLSIDEAFVLVNPPPRRYTARGQKLDRWDKRPDVPTDPPIRFSQATDLDAVVPPHPPGLLNTHTRSSGRLLPIFRLAGATFTNRRLETRPTRDDADQEALMSLPERQECCRKDKAGTRPLWTTGIGPTGKVG
jgi:hypothetical protein